MKKLLAILTALVMAASFAVVNVYAVNYDQNILPISDVHTEKIPLYPIAASNTKVVETQFTIPIYALYGYMTQGDYLSLYLPVGMPGTANDSAEVSLIAKGVEYQLKPMPDPLRYSSGNAAPAVYENKINFGYGVHSYNSITDDTTIPPSTVFGDYSSLMIVIRRTVWDTYDISKDAELFAEGGDYALSAYMKHYSESDGEVIGSTYYGQYWDVTSKQISEEAEGFEFASVGDSELLWHGLKVVETQITIPVYALYGYMTQGYYLSLNLPTGMPDTVYGTTEVSLMANGVVYLLKPMPDPLSYSSGDTVPAVYENIINFGKEIHSYNAVTDDTTILPSSEFGDYTSLTVVIRRTVWDTYDISKDAELFAEGGDYAFSACMKICSESDGSEVIGSTSYGQNWNVTSEEYPIVTGDTIDLSWDHTLAARNIVDSAKAIKVVVKLSEPLNGMASYTLKSKTSPNWWAYDLTSYDLTSYELNGSADELVFDIPMDVLEDGALDSFNICEDITLYNSTIMSDYMHINRKYIEEQGISSPYGYLSWVDGDDRVYYEGQPVNYADGASADPFGASVRALEAYMEITVADPMPVNLSELMTENLETVRSSIHGALPGLRIDEGSSYNLQYFNVYEGSGQSEFPDVSFIVSTNPGDFCTYIFVTPDNGDISFLKDHPEVCAVDGIPLALTQEELVQRLSESNIVYYLYTYTYEGDEQIPAYKYADYTIFKYFSNGDYTRITYGFSQLRYVNGQYVLLSDEEYAESFPVDVSVSYMDFSRLPDLSYIDDLSLVGKTPEEAQSILDSLCQGLRYDVSSYTDGDHFTVFCDSSASNVISCDMKDGVITGLYLHILNLPKNLEGMPSVINQQKLDEMLADKNLSSRVVKDEYDGVVQYSYEFYIDGKTYTYFEDDRALLNKGTYTLMVQKTDYILGDVNNDGEVTLDDAVLTLRKAMNVEVVSDVFIDKAADVTGDGEISLDDAVAILKIAMNVTTS